MSAEYSVEEVLAMAAEIIDYGGTQAGLMLTAYAERIKADESAVTDAVVRRAENAFWPAYIECKCTHGAGKDAHTTGMRAALLAVWPNTPAQAAQVGRTAKDYAIEHAGYLADAAEHLMTVTQDANIAADQLDEDGGDDETNTNILVRDNDHAQTVLSEAQSGLRAAIYEFKKRRDRAAEPAAYGEAVQQEEYGGPDFEERCETLAKIERDMRIYLDEGMLLTPYTLELLCNRIKNVRDAGHDNVVMSLYNFRTLRRLAAQPRAVPADFAEYLKDPANVHVMMLLGVIAIPSIRSIVHLRGEVPNGEDAQLARIAELQEQVATLKDKPAERVVEDVERNAARYRFIRDEQATIIYKRKQDGEWEPLVDTYSTSTRCASLDTAIDTAMLAAAPQPGESNNKPADCSGDPASCPDNEGRGCYCSDLRRAGESA